MGLALLFFKPQVDFFPQFFYPYDFHWDAFEKHNLPNMERFTPPVIPFRFWFRHFYFSYYSSFFMQYFSPILYCFAFYKPFSLLGKRCS